MEGDPVVDRLMKPVLDALIRHGQRGEARTDIYNRAYEAVSNGLVVLDTMRDQLSKANARAEQAERELAALREQLGKSDVLDCQYCHKWFPTNTMYSVDACCAEHQQFLLESK